MKKDKFINDLKEWLELHLLESSHITVDIVVCDIKKFGKESKARYRNLLDIDVMIEDLEEEVPKMFNNSSTKHNLDDYNINIDSFTKKNFD